MRVILKTSFQNLIENWKSYIAALILTILTSDSELCRLTLLCAFSLFLLAQIKGLNFPGSHNPRFCQFVIDRSRHMLKPVSTTYNFHSLAPFLFRSGSLIYFQTQPYQLFSVTGCFQTFGFCWFFASFWFGRTHNNHRVTFWQDFHCRSTNTRSMESGEWVPTPSCQCVSKFFFKFWIEFHI